LSEMYFYALDKPGTFGILNQILHNTIRDLFITHKNQHCPRETATNETS